MKLNKIPHNTTQHTAQYTAQYCTVQHINMAGTAPVFSLHARAQGIVTLKVEWLTDGTKTPSISDDWPSTRPPPPTDRAAHAWGNVIAGGGIGIDIAA